ncbi:MAG: sugar phosphate nucleotidyltransferase [Bacteroidota bacterium]
MRPTLLVLAAGMGSRYGSLKQVDSIGPSGEAIIDYSIYDAIKAGFGKVVFVIRKDIEDTFKEVFGNKFSEKIPVEYVYQELDNLPEGVSVPEERVKPWGTGHAVLVAASAIKEPFAVINADDFYGSSSFNMLADFLSPLSSEDTTHCMIGYQLDNTLSDFGYVSRGVCEISPEKLLLGVTERTHIQHKEGKIVFKEGEDLWTQIEGETIVSMNMLGFGPAVFNQYSTYFKEFIQENIQELKAEFYIPTVVNRLVEEGKGTVEVLASKEKWFGVTYKEDKEIAKDKIAILIEKGVYPADLWG